jgi:hypothetical protein
MATQYQIDGDIFREITPHWLCATISEFLIKARKTDIDQDGTVVEYVQLNDGRIFSRPACSVQATDASRKSSVRPRTMRQSLGDQSLTQPR